MIHVIINRPVLTDEERAKRMEEVKRAAVQLVLATEKAKQRKLNNQKYIGGTNVSVCNTRGTVTNVSNS